MFSHMILNGLVQSSKTSAFLKAISQYFMRSSKYSFKDVIAIQHKTEISPSLHREFCIITTMPSKLQWFQANTFLLSDLDSFMNAMSTNYSFFSFHCFNNIINALIALF